jgi:hypothetical protein
MEGRFPATVIAQFVARASGSRAQTEAHEADHDGASRPRRAYRSPDAPRRRSPNERCHLPWHRRVRFARRSSFHHASATAPRSPRSTRRSKRRWGRAARRGPMSGSAPWTRSRCERGLLGRSRRAGPPRGEARPMCCTGCCPAVGWPQHFNRRIRAGNWPPAGGSLSASCNSRMSQGSPRDMEVLRYLGTYRFLSRAQIEEFVLGGSALTARSREVVTWRILRRLRERELVTTNALLATEPDGMRAATSRGRRGTRRRPSEDPSAARLRRRAERTRDRVYEIDVAERSQVLDRVRPQLRRNDRRDPRALGRREL